MDYNWVPFIGFLIIVITLIVKVWQTKKNGIIIRSRSDKKKRSYLFLVFGVIFLLWLYEISKPVFLRSYSILPEFALVKLTDSNLIQIIGSLVILKSLVIWIITLFHFKTSLRFGLDEKNTGKLITTGIFAFSRNPFFLSLNIYFIGITLIIPNLFFIVFTVLAIVSIHFFILKEEKFLRNVYGEEYRKYAKNTRRYF